MTLPETKTNLIKYFPTLETLFGELDVCECEHCRSVLSPAAYLVDLLRFLDPDPKVWLKTLDDWRKPHGGAEYPFENTTVQKAWAKATGGTQPARD